MTPSKPKLTARALLTYIAVVVSILAVITAVVAIKHSDDAKNSASDLRGNLVEACQTARAPLQVRFQFELDQSNAQSIKDLQRAFPQFPPGQIRKSVKAERENLRHLLAVYDPAKCPDLY